MRDELKEPACTRRSALFTCSKPSLKISAALGRGALAPFVSHFGTFGAGPWSGVMGAACADRLSFPRRSALFPPAVRSEARRNRSWSLPHFSSGRPVQDAFERRIRLFKRLPHEGARAFLRVIEDPLAVPQRPSRRRRFCAPVSLRDISEGRFRKKRRHPARTGCGEAFFPGKNAADS